MSIAVWTRTPHMSMSWRPATTTDVRLVRPRFRRRRHWGAPTSGLSVTAQSASEISLSWSAIADATHYKLYRSAAGAELFAQTGGEIGATVYVDSGLDANTSYEYELEACNDNGCSGRSAAVSATTALGMPTAGLTATAQSASAIFDCMERGGGCDTLQVVSVGGGCGIVRSDRR